MRYPKIAKEIIKLKNNDLELRNKLLQSGQLDDRYHPKMAALHTKNAETLNDLLDSIGYPTIDKVGSEGSTAAWLLIQHAISHPIFMKKCALLLEKEVLKNNADPIHFAYLSDRIAVFQNQPQAFGTQFDWDEQGQMSPYPCDDIKKVNERRKKLGLNTVEEQTILLRKEAKAQNQIPPKDFARRKHEIEQWKKSVGWITS